MTPVELEVLLHYFYIPEDHPGVDEIPAVKGAVRDHIHRGLLEYQPDDRVRPALKLTERGRVFVSEGLCKLPLPVQKWVMP